MPDLSDENFSLASDIGNKFLSSMIGAVETGSFFRPIIVEIVKKISQYC